LNVSSGWQGDEKISYDSAYLSARQITVDHLHYATIAGCHAASDLYGDVLRPTVHREIYSFAAVPRALREMHYNVQTGIPILCVVDGCQPRFRLRSKEPAPRRPVGSGLAGIDYLDAGS
jgi:hypothetical protein